MDKELRKENLSPFILSSNAFKQWRDHISIRVFQYEESIMEDLDGNDVDISDFQVVTALYFLKKTMGVATYREDSNAILLDSFPFSAENMERIVSFIKETTHTTKFLVSPTTSTNRTILDLLSANENGSIQCQTLKSSCWQESFAKTCIATHLRVRSTFDDVGMGIMQHLSQICDTECTEMMQSLGALVFYLTKEIFNLSQDHVFVSEIYRFPPDNRLRMDFNVFRSLQIFKEDYHPNWTKGGGKSKEGFSLFALMDRTVTLPGRRKLHEWMVSPLNDMDIILNRQENVSFFMQDSSAEFLLSVSSHLKRTFDIPRLMLSMKKASMKPVDWLHLHRTFCEWKSMLEVFYLHGDTTQHQFPFSERFFSTSHGSTSLMIVNELLGIIDTVVDVSKCAGGDYMIIRDGYNEILDQKRHTFDHIESELILAAQQILDQNPAIQVSSVDKVLVIVQYESHNLRTCLLSMFLS